MTTHIAKVADVKNDFILIDARDQILGRLAAFAAHRLRGKHKPSYAPHMNVGDHVIVINAEKIKVTGKKLTDKVYHRHTGYPGGLKTRVLGKMLESQNPGELIEMAVRGMLPKNPLGREMFRNLKVYAGSEHPHVAQNPILQTISTVAD
jgi:large subunit ribosomal protein L13